MSPGPASHALALRCFLRLLSWGGTVARAAWACVPWGPTCRPVAIRQHAYRGIYFKVIALGFEDHAAPLEVVVEAKGVHRTNSSRGCTVALVPEGVEKNSFSPSVRAATERLFVLPPTEPL